MARKQTLKQTRKHNITVEDLWRFERVGAPSLSPDGAQAVAAVTRFDMDENKSASSLWLLSTLGGAPRQLTQCGDKDGTPRWSPHRGDQGDLIAFTARREQAGKKDDETQLYLIAPDGGEARRAAEVATGVEAFRWCPDGRRLVFVSWVRPELKGAKAQAAAPKAFKERKETGYVTSEAQYRFWDRNLPLGRVPHLHLLDIASAKVRDLFEGSGYELTRRDPGATSFDISPDGRRLVFAFDPNPEKRPDGRFALAEMDLKSGRVVVIARDPEWDFGAPRYSPDGQRIAFLASHQQAKHTMPSQLAVWERASAVWDLFSAEWDHEPHAPLQWEDDGQALLFAAEQKGRTHLWRFDLPDRRAEVVVAGGWVSGFDKAAGTLVTLADSALHPARLSVHGAGEAPRRIESFNDDLLGSLALGRVEEVWVKGANAGANAAGGDAAGTGGDDVQMWLVYPPGFDAKKKYPVMHNIHGGPHTGPGDNWHYRWNTQLFAAQGLRGGQRQLPRQLGLRLCLPGQHHPPLGRAGTARHRGRHRLAAGQTLGGQQTHLRHRRQLWRFHGRLDEWPCAKRPLPGLCLPCRLLRLGGHVRRRRLELACQGARRLVLGRHGARACAKPACVGRQHGHADAGDPRRA